MNDEDVRCMQLKMELRSRGYRLRSEEREDGFVVGIARGTKTAITVITSLPFVKESDAWQACLNQLSSPDPILVPPPDLLDLDNPPAEIAPPDFQEMYEKTQKANARNAKLEECQLTAKHIREDLSMVAPNEVKNRVLIRFQTVLEGTITSPGLQDEFRSLMAQLEPGKIPESEEGTRLYSEACLAFMAKVLEFQ